MDSSGLCWTNTYIHSSMRVHWMPAELMLEIECVSTWLEDEKTLLLLGRSRDQDFEAVFPIAPPAKLWSSTPIGLVER